MTRKAFNKIAEGLHEALSVARGERLPFKLHVPREIDVRSIRAAQNLSQADFASLFGFTLNQIRDWEQGRSRPLGGVRAYLMLIARAPNEVLELLRQDSRRLREGERLENLKNRAARAR